MLTDTEILNFIIQNNISVSGSSQQGYSRWHFLHLGHTLLADDTDFRKGFMRAYRYLMER